MHNTSKVAHFHQTPHIRLLEIYAVNATFRKVYESHSLKEKIIRFLIHALKLQTCKLMCGRSKAPNNNRTRVSFKVIKSYPLETNIWHVEGTLAGKRKVLMLVDKANDVCDVIKK